MDRPDRLNTLMERFSLSTHIVPAEDANLLVTQGTDGELGKVYLKTGSQDVAELANDIDFAAFVDWGGSSNPLMAALPPVIELDLSDDPTTRGLVDMIGQELQANRCGSGSVVNRLCEVLIVKLMRAQIERGSAEPGLLAGLADPRLSRAIVEMHNRPDRDWRNEELATLAGLSLSRFSELFSQTVAQSPTAYLRSWRLTLARQDVLKGDRVSTVSRRYGYASPEGFSRAYKKHFGLNPIHVRTAASH